MNVALDGENVDEHRFISEEETFDVNCTLIQPWSTPVMKTRVPDKILRLMTTMSDAVLASKDAASYADQLVGQLEKETLVPLEVLRQAGLSVFLENLVTQYVFQCQLQKYPEERVSVLNSNYQSSITSMWICSQFEHEYNPTHLHMNCDVSAVLYLKMPEMLADRKAGRTDDGCITFIGNAGADTRLSKPVLQIKPEVGDLYLFGANQLHSVNPFRCPEAQVDRERRSISFNSKFELLAS